MTKCFVKHGFFTADGGKGTTDKLHKYIRARGYEVIDDDYGFLTLLGVRFTTDRIVEDLVEKAKVNPGCAYVGFSHGGYIGAKALEAGAPFGTMLLIHPALRCDWTPPDSFKGKIHVFFHHTDYATWGAKAIRMFSPFNLVFGRSEWGSAGSVGLDREDPRIINHEGSQGHANEGFSNIQNWGVIWANCLPRITV